MNVDPERARKLCSEAEFELFCDSREPAILAFTAEGLTRRAYQAQKLLELWGERLGIEKDAGWGKVGEARRKAATGYVTARQKMELFEDVWKRFDTRLRDVLKNPALPARDTVKHRRQTGNLNKGGHLLNPPADD